MVILSESDQTLGMYSEKLAARCFWKYMISSAKKTDPYGRLINRLFLKINRVIEVSD